MGKYSIKNKEKHGFTLTELLAVIAIMGVIAIIAVPILLNSINRSRMSALKNSAESLLKETTLKKAMDKIGADSISITDSRLSLKNNQFTSGLVRKNSNGKLELKNVTNGKYCINGISGSLKVVKGNCVNNDTSVPTLTLASGYIGSNEITVLASAVDNESGIIGYEYKIGSGSYTKMQDDNFYRFTGLTKNTSYTITVRVTNGAGLKVEKSITLKTKTASAATFVVSDASRWTQKKDVTINFPKRLNGMTFRYRIGTGEWIDVPSGTKKELELKENAIVYADVIVNGEIISSSVNVTKIDNTPPVITSITPSTTGWTRQVTIQVIATDTPSGISAYSFNDGATWTSASTYTVTKNGTYKIKVKDYANNITSGEITITKIDRTGPKCVSSGGNKTWINTSRTIYGTCIDNGTGAGCVTDKISKVVTVDAGKVLNGKVSPGSVYDEAGNETVCPATEIVRIDKLAPTCATTGGGSDWKNVSSMTLYGKCSDSDSGCTKDVKRSFTDETRDKNRKETPGIVYDKAGNSVTCPSTLVRIDRTAPTCSVSGGSTSWTAGSRTVTGTCSDAIGECKSNISYTYNGTSGAHYNISNGGAAGAGNGGYVYDLAGNRASCAANQTIKIDKKAPACSVSGGSTSWTSGSRTVTGACSDTGGSGCQGNISYTYNGTNNGNYVTSTAGAAGNSNGGYVYDNVGNRTACAANQTVKIDKLAPTCTTSGGTNGYTSNDVTIVGTCNDNGGSGCTGNVSQTFRDDTNGTYSPGTVYDSVGHSAYCPATTVQISKEPPACPSISATVNAPDWVRAEKTTLTITPATGTESWDWYTNESNGNYKYYSKNTGVKTKDLGSEGYGRVGKIVVRNSAGRERTCYTSTYYLDNKPPTATITMKLQDPVTKKVSGTNYSSGSTTYQFVYVNYTDKNDVGSGVASVQVIVTGASTNGTFGLGRSIQATGTSTVQLKITDNVGNIGYSDKKTIKRDINSGHEHKWTGRGDKIVNTPQWVGTCGHSHTTGYNIYCAVCGKRGEGWVCPWLPYGEPNGWTIFPGK